MTTTIADPMTQVANVANKQKRMILMILTGIFAVAAAYGIHMTRKSEHQAAGAEALYKARTIFGKEVESALETLRPKTKAPAKKGAPTPLDDWNPAEAKFDVATLVKSGIGAMEQVASNFDGTLAAFEARLLVGNLFYDHDSSPENFKKAYAYYKAAADRAPGNDQAIAGLYAAGFAQEALGNCADAVKTFDQALNYGKSMHQADLLKAQARCYETLGKKEDAIRSYEKLISVFPNSEHSRFAQTKKADLK